MTASEEKLLRIKVPVLRLVQRTADLRQTDNYSWRDVLGLESYLAVILGCDLWPMLRIFCGASVVTAEVLAVL